MLALPKSHRRSLYSKGAICKMSTYWTEKNINIIWAAARVEIGCQKKERQRSNEGEEKASGEGLAVDGGGDDGECSGVGGDGGEKICGEGLQLLRHLQSPQQVSQRERKPWRSSAQSLRHAGRSNRRCQAGDSTNHESDAWSRDLPPERRTGEEIRRHQQGRSERTDDDLLRRKSHRVRRFPRGKSERTDDHGEEKLSRAISEHSSRISLSCSPPTFHLRACNCSPGEFFAEAISRTRFRSPDRQARVAQSFFGEEERQDNVEGAVPGEREGGGRGEVVGAGGAAASAGAAPPQRLVSGGKRGRECVRCEAISSTEGRRLNPVGP